MTQLSISRLAFPARDCLSITTSAQWACDKKERPALKGKVDLLGATVAVTSFFSASGNPERRWRWLYLRSKVTEGTGLASYLIPLHIWALLLCKQYFIFFKRSHLHLLEEEKGYLLTSIEL